MFGLSERSYILILNALEAVPEIDEVRVFGSRATGRFKQGSDLDLVLWGKALSPEIVDHIRAVLNQELPIPYRCDVLAYDSLENEALRDRIKEEGKLFFKREAEALSRS